MIRVTPVRWFLWAIWEWDGRIWVKIGHTRQQPNRPASKDCQYFDR